MSGRAQGLLLRFLERIMDGPPCPNCKHDIAIHNEDDHCLGFKEGTPAYWCPCKSTKKEKEKEKA